MSRPKKWTDEKIVSEIKRIMKLINIIDRLPTVAEIQRHSTCYDSINKNGGMKWLSEIMNLPVGGDVLLYTKNCLTCGKEFTSRYRSTQYCSQACRNKSYGSNRSKPAAKEKHSDIRTMRDVRRSRAFEKENFAREKGLSYADLQIADSIAKYARVEL